jgi:hypothetical protein
MKRERYIFATILIPFILLSFNLKHFNFETKDKVTPLRIQQEEPFLQEEKLPAPKNTQRVIPKKSLIQKHTLTKNMKGREAESPLPKILRRVRPTNLAIFRYEGEQDKHSFFNREKFILINEGRPYQFSEKRFAPDQVLVKFKPTLSEEMREATVASYQSRKIKRIPRLDIYQLQIPEDLSVEEMLSLLERNPDVEYAEPNYIRHIAQRTPDDPYFIEQYALYNSGQEVGPPSSPQSGENRADIKAREGWEETLGSEDVIIAVLDTGVDFNHPDLDDKLLSTGYDFVNDDPDPTDDHWHGTHVAGIAAAETNNGEGIAGVAWNCKILPIKIADNTGSILVSTLIMGINWAVQNGADVINLSIGGPGSSQPERDAIRDAYNNGIVVVAAAGNAGVATDYPAAYDECMAVAATDYDDLRPSWSNYGPEIDVAAPGEDVFSLYPTNLVSPPFLPYAWGTGTSASVPHVSGLAALIKSIKGEILSVEDIMNIIRFTADDVNSANNPGRDDFIGYGRIDMRIALVPIIISSSNEQR